MYALKQLPEDFIVKEKSIIVPEGNGKYAYFLLKKKNLNTLNALQIIARKLNIDLKRFGFAGNKDKRAITEQLCSVAIGNNSFREISTDCLKAEYIGKGNIPVSLGMLEGNYFDIIIRNLEPATKIIPLNKFINYFGEQRFGGNNTEVGGALVKRNFEKACLLIDQPTIKEHLQSHPTNFIGALRRLPRKLLRFYVCSYQSYLWNETVKELTKKKIKLPKEVPILGFDVQIEDTIFADTIKPLMEKEDINSRDFIIKEFPELSSEGASREVIAAVKDLILTNLEDDNLNTGKKICKASFFLKKGGYATEFIKQLMQNA